MDRLTFVVEMTKALAWPAATAVGLILFRKMLPQLQSLKYDKLEVQFDREVGAVQKRAQAELPPIPERSSHEAAREQLLNLAMTSPEAAIIEAWRYLENQLLETERDHAVGVAPPVRTMPMVLAALLYKDGVISDAQHSLIQRLRVLRNDATHGRSGPIDAERATSYVESALRLAASFGKLSTRAAAKAG
jgi:hypothetical protein